MPTFKDPVADAAELREAVRCLAHATRLSQPSSGCLADPAVLEAVSPDQDDAFDPRNFVLHNGTVYLLATGAWRWRFVAPRGGLHGRHHRSARHSRPVLVAEGGETGIHHDSRPSVALAGAEQVGRPRRQHDLGRIDREGDTRRRLDLSRSNARTRRQVTHQ